MMLTADLQAHTEPLSQFQFTHNINLSQLAILMVAAKQKQQLLQTLILEQFIIFQLEA